LTWGAIDYTTPHMIAGMTNMTPVGSGLVHMGTLSSRPAVAVMAFHDPARMNAMTQAMSDDFRAGVERLKDRKPGAVVVTGIGRAFSAGGDMELIRRKQGQTAEVNSAEMLAFYKSFLGILDLRAPVIAAINGPAIGAGLCFACACDRRFAAAVDRNILGFSFVKLGLTPGMGGTIFPERLVGRERAERMLAEGDNISPREAFDIGMVDAVVPKKELMEFALDSAMKLAEDSAADARRSLLRKRIGWHALRERLAGEARLQGASFLTAEHRRLYAAFMKNLKSKPA